jgi:hypothetical protein
MSECSVDSLRASSGWRQQPAIERVGKAIKKMERRDSMLAVEGAVLFLQKGVRDLVAATPREECK